MAPDDPPASTAPTRRALRTGSHPVQPGPSMAADAGTTATLTAPAETTADATPAVAEPLPPVPPAPRPRALAWLPDSAVTTGGVAWPDAGAASPSPDLIARWPHRSALRAPLLVPLATVLAIATVYAVAMLLWPLHSVTPSVAASEVAVVGAPAAEMPWPAQGAAAVTVAGLPSSAASGGDALTMASITKVVTCLVVLEQLPLALGESGPSYYFSYQNYWEYLSQNESALMVPVGGTLTQYQLLEGTLIGSAGNYVDRLAYSLYPNDEVYATAAMEWLSAHGISDITIADPSGIGPGNTATPEGLLALAQQAMAHPVIAEIVAKQSVELPAAGVVTNSNALLGDAGVVGVKTGLLDGDYNVLLAKDIEVGDTTVRAYADVLHQPDSDTRWAAARELFTALEEQLQPTAAVPAGTVVGEITTEWGESVDIVTAADASVILWNGASPTASASLALSDGRSSGTNVGAVTVDGPLDDASVAAELAADIEGPSPWWRLTHPLELLGLD